jgi:hypothetical protein
MAKEEAKKEKESKKEDLLDFNKPEDIKKFWDEKKKHSERQK